MSIIRHHLKWHKTHLEDAIDSVIEAGDCELAGLPQSAEWNFNCAHQEIALAKNELENIMESISYQKKLNPISAHKKQQVVKRIVVNRFERFERLLLGRALP